MRPPERCPECGLPAAAGRGKCWACLQREPDFAALRAAEPLRLPPCPHCGNPYAGYLRACPGCRRPTPRSPLHRELGSDWQLEGILGQSITLRRTLTGRLGSRAPGLTPVLLAGVGLALLVSLALLVVGGRAAAPWPLLGWGLPLALLAAWAWLGREELHAAPGLLERRVRWGRLGWTHRITHGVLRLECHDDSQTWLLTGGPVRPEVQLFADGLGGRLEIEAGMRNAHPRLLVLAQLLAEATGFENRSDGLLS